MTTSELQAGQESAVARKFAISFRWSSRKVSAALLAPIVGVAFASVLIQAYGFQGLPTIWVGLVSAVSTPAAIASTLAWSLPLIPAVLGVMIAFRVGVYSLAAEGQIYAGAFAAAMVGALLPVAAPAVHQGLAVLAAASVGAVISFVLGWLYAVWKVDILATLLASFILVGLCIYLGTGPLNDASSPAPAATAPIAGTARFGLILEKSQLTWAVLPVVATVVVIWWLVQHSALGYKWRVVGSSPGYASAIGIDVARVQITGMVLSGALCGFSGSILVLTTMGRFSADIGHGIGWLAIMIALIARLKVGSALIWTLAYAVMQSASRRIDQIAGVPTDMSVMVICAVLITATCSPAIVSIIASGWTRLRVPRRKGTNNGMA
ncbi:ABC transporter permease [Arthrobacter sp. SD76]|uniref:ABC transporter permease n=1 Tax=Arthrobacter sp. SD76 TaxID=3415007 RepID=UPI003C706F81